MILQKLKELEKEVLGFAADNGLGPYLPHVHLRQLQGIKTSEYALELAQLTVWIGWLRWIRWNGFENEPDPVLQPLETILRKDAIPVGSDPDNPTEPKGPADDGSTGTRRS